MCVWSRGCGESYCTTVNSWICVSVRVSVGGWLGSCSHPLFSVCGGLPHCQHSTMPLLFSCTVTLPPLCHFPTVSTVQRHCCSAAQSLCPLCTQNCVQQYFCFICDQTVGQQQKVRKELRLHKWCIDWGVWCRKLQWKQHINIVVIMIYMSLCSKYDWYFVYFVWLF